MDQWDFQGPPRTWDPLMARWTHTIPIRIPKDMGNGGGFTYVFMFIPIWGGFPF